MFLTNKNLLKSKCVFLKKWAILDLFFIYFRSFQTTQTIQQILQQIIRIRFLDIKLKPGNFLRSFLFKLAKASDDKLSGAEMYQITI